MTPDKHKAKLKKLTGLCGDTDINMAKAESSTSQEAKKPNYFIAIRISDRGIHSNVEKVQNEVVSYDKRLKPFRIPLEALHLTLFVMHLEDERQIEKAKEILQQCKTTLRKSVLASGPFKFKFKGLDYFPPEKRSDPQKQLRDPPKRVPKILYVKPAEEEGNTRLYDMANVVRNTFTEKGIPSADPREWIPHIAVIKLRRNDSKVSEIPEESFKASKVMDFGEEQISSLYLCPNGEKKAPDGFYSWEEKIDLEARHGSSLYFVLLSFFLVLSAISFHYYLNTYA